MNPHARRRAWAVFSLCTALSVAGGTALAGEARPLADDPMLERRVTALAEELRCLVCQNQTLADSHAALAMDMKSQIRDQLKAGRNDQQVRDYMVDRFGDFVLYRPPVKATTVLLWVGPFALLMGAAFALRRALRRLRDAVGDLPDDQDRRALAAARLGHDG